MLREAREARFERRATPLGPRYGFVPGRHPAPIASWGRRSFRALWAEQSAVPVPLVADGARVWWAFGDRVWWEDEGLEPGDVAALVGERDRQRARRIARAHDALVAERFAVTGAAGVAGPWGPDATERAGERRDGRPRRAGISLEVRRAVWERDGGRCVACGAAFELQYDHVIPVALGGGDGPENLQVLCGTCNRRKGASLG